MPASRSLAADPQCEMSLIRDIMRALREVQNLRLGVTKKEP